MNVVPEKVDEMDVDARVKRLGSLTGQDAIDFMAEALLLKGRRIYDTINPETMKECGHHYSIFVVCGVIDQFSREIVSESPETLSEAGLVSSIQALFRSLVPLVSFADKKCTTCHLQSI
jgi:hypothetical protein